MESKNSTLESNLISEAKKTRQKRSITKTAQEQLDADIGRSFFSSKFHR